MFAADIVTNDIVALIGKWIIARTKDVIDRWEECKLFE